MSAAIVATSLALAACSDPSIDALPYACTSSSECGPGFVCGPSGRCERGTGPTTTEPDTTVDTALPDVLEPCFEGVVRCTDTSRERCDGDGLWVDIGPCSGETPTCIDGACGCTPDTRRCDISQPQLCSSSATQTPDELHN